MSASSIPNLLSLRGSRGGTARGGLGRGGGRRLPGGPGSARPSSDEVIQGTDNDAAVSRLNAVQYGYMQDPYAQYFVTGPFASRLPIIRRGTYTRTAAVDRLVSSFLNAPRDSSDNDDNGAGRMRQIVSLGAGTDTRPYRLFSGGDTGGLIYHEVDFDNIIDKKLRITQNQPALRETLFIPRSESSQSRRSAPPSGGEYFCHGADLRQLSTTGDEVLAGLRRDVPTLILSECCLCYLSPAESAEVIEYFTSRIPNVALAIYEPIEPSDSFGQMMVSNLRARQIHMPTLEEYPTAKEQEARLRKAGFDRVRHETIEAVWKKWISPEEKERVDSLEGLDEVEEWNLLAAHYVVVWGSKGVGFDALG